MKKLNSLLAETIEEDMRIYSDAFDVLFLILQTIRESKPLDRNNKKIIRSKLVECKKLFDEIALEL